MAGDLLTIILGPSVDLLEPVTVDINSPLVCLCLSILTSTFVMVGEFLCTLQYEPITSTFIIIIINRRCLLNYFCIYVSLFSVYDARMILKWFL